MSSARAFFSSSSRSIRSTIARSWSAATPPTSPVLAAAGAAPAVSPILIDTSSGKAGADDIGGLPAAQGREMSVPRRRRGALHERLDARLRAAEDEGMDVVRALVGVDRLEVQDVADHAELVGDAVAAMHVAGDAGDIQCLAAIVALQQRDHLGRRLALVLEPAEAERRRQAERDLGLHVGELLLDQLVGGERPAELLAVERVLARALPAELGGAHRAPGDAVARVVEAAERAAEARDVGQHVF